jgi:hypothetical protein
MLSQFCDPYERQQRTEYIQAQGDHCRQKAKRIAAAYSTSDSLPFQLPPIALLRMESGPYAAIISCCNIKYATAAAHPHIRAAATNQMTTNAAVAVIIDEVFELARSFATPRHAAHRTNPTSLMTAVRLTTSRCWLLSGEMVAETSRCR